VNASAAECSLQAVYPAPDVNEVAIYDDLVPAPLQLRLLQLLRRPIWAYGWKSAKERDRFSFWHARFAGGDEQCLLDCAPELAANAAATPVQELWELLSGSLLAGHEPVRVYANAHTYGVEGYLHVDSQDENYFSTIYYAHPEWSYNWAGETVFVSQRTGAIVSSVHPHPGRLVTFRGVTPHVARSPSRDCPELRISVVFKTRLR